MRPIAIEIRDKGAVANREALIQRRFPAKRQSGTNPRPFVGWRRAAPLRPASPSTAHLALVGDPLRRHLPSQQPLIETKREPLSGSATCVPSIDEISLTKKFSLSSPLLLLVLVLLGGASRGVSPPVSFHSARASFIRAFGAAVSQGSRKGSTDISIPVPATTLLF